MNSPLQNQFKTQIAGLRGFAFQDFITRLYLLKYGSNGFLPPRRVRDSGSDGIILSENRVVACYAPDNYDKKDFWKKVKGDYESFEKCLKSQYSNWSFISNIDIPQDVISKIHSELNRHALVLGIQNIVSSVEELSSGNKRKIGSFLNIDPDYFAREFLGEILEDLLRGSPFTDSTIQYETLLYFPDKIKLNFTLDEVESVKTEYDLFLEDGLFRNISVLLSNYEDEEQDRIKIRLMYDLDSIFQGTFRERIHSLTKLYLNRYSNENDDEYLTNIRAVLLFFFEQCIIGKKTEDEK